VKCRIPKILDLFGVILIFRRLLRILINKLGDPSKAVVSKSIELLKKV
jgi:hypothetical protein